MTATSRDSGLAWSACDALRGDGADRVVAGSKDWHRRRKEQDDEGDGDEE